MRSSTLLGLPLLAGLLFSACVPVPVILPPSKLRLGGGPGFGEVTDGPGVNPDVDAAAFFSLTWGLHPLKILVDPDINSFDVDTFDVGAGFIYESILTKKLDNQSPLVGGYLEGSYVLWRDGDREKNGVWRLSLVGRGEALRDTGLQGDVGFGTSVGFLIEGAWWVESASATIDATGEEGAFFGVYIGEGGVGLDVSANYRDVGGQQYTAIFFSLNFRLPAVFGIAFIPLD